MATAVNMSSFITLEIYFKKYLSRGLKFYVCWVVFGNGANIILSDGKVAGHHRPFQCVGM